MCSDLPLGEVTVCALFFSSIDTYFSDKMKSVFVQIEEANDENEKKDVIKQIVKIKKYVICKNYVLFFRSLVITLV